MSYPASLDEVLEILEHAPTDPPSGAPDLWGYECPGFFVCSECVGRMIARGYCHLPSTWKPVWKSDLVELGVDPPVCGACCP